MSDWSDFGALLHDTRSSFGWSLEDVAHRTRIPVATLRQLEQNDYSKFASRSYAKSFLAQYAEHLGIDATEWLDHFETGDSLANLDSYEYLKDHDERVEAASLAVKVKRARPRKQRVRKETAPRPRETNPAALQPLLLFLVSAGIITAAVFGFMKLSADLSEDGATTQNPAVEERLKPVTGISEGRPNVRDFSSVPRALPVTSEDNLVAGTPNRTSRTETLNATPIRRQDPPPALTFETAPPRAVIVEE